MLFCDLFQLNEKERENGWEEKQNKHQKREKSVCRWIQMGGETINEEGCFKDKGQQVGVMYICI